MHYTDDQLSDYAFDPMSNPHPLDVEGHLATCTDCASRLAEIQLIDEGLRDPLPWKAAHLFDISDEPHSLMRAAAEMERERRDAQTRLEPHLSNVFAFTRAAIERDETFHTAGAVQVLATRAEALRESDPELSLALADSAVAIATTLANADELRTYVLLARAWMERAATLVIIGKYKDAEKAAAKCEAALEDAPDAMPHDWAMVWLLRAIICAETERLDDAQSFAAAAAPIFAEFGDNARYVKALIASANVLCHRNRYEEAVAQFERVVATSRTLDNPLLLARALQNLGEARAAREQFDAAVACFVESRAISGRIGAESEKMRSTWSLANVLLLTGAFEEAIERLIEARRGFEALGVINDAALVRLQLAEALLAAERHAEVPEVLAGVAMTFASEDMARNANIALAYLREAIAGNPEPVRLVRHVRSYLEALPDDAGRTFIPLQ